MKTKLFFAAMAAVAIVGCNKEPQGVNPVENGQTSYLAVSIKATGSMTRADEVDNPEDFEYGTYDENAIATAAFYLFDDAGDPYILEDGTNMVTVATKDLTANQAKPTENIEAYSKVILVLKGQKDEPPTQMVALINTAKTYAGSTLAELQAASTDIATSGYFTMSNSVYAANKPDGQPVVAVPVLPENLFTDPVPGENDQVGNAYQAPADAEVVPVEIYVERVAAKVRVKVDEELVNDSNLILVDQETDTYAEITGWEVTNTTAESHLIKNYAYTDLFSPVNNPVFFRSYWAKTIESASAIHGLTYGQINNELGASSYYHENTIDPTPELDENGMWYNDVDKDGVDNAEMTQAPQLIVAARLCNADGSTKAFARWYGKDYADVEGLKANMINNAAKQIYVEDDKTQQTNDYRGITVDDVAFNQVDDQTSYYDVAEYDGNRRYEVIVEPVEDMVYYKYDATQDKMVVMTESEVVSILSKIAPAMIWEAGQTYYYSLISHFGDAKGMVRNHIYDITISGMKGFGTPVYDPTKIITPEPTVEQDAYHLTAQINVLSWNVVSQDVELGF